MKLAKNTDPDKYVYTGYCVGFDSWSEFSLPEVNMSSSVHIDNKKKHILILGKGPTQGLDDTALTAKAQYSISFSRSNINFV